MELDSIENKVFFVYLCEDTIESYFTSMFEGSEVIDGYILKYKDAEYEIVKLEAVGIDLQRDLQMCQLLRFETVMKIPFEAYYRKTVEHNYASLEFNYDDANSDTFAIFSNDNDSKPVELKQTIDGWLIEFILEFTWFDDPSVMRFVATKNDWKVSSENLNFECKASCTEAWIDFLKSFTIRTYEYHRTYEY